MHTPPLQLIDLGLRYGDRWLFRHLDRVIEPGRATVLHGPSGSGKSQLLRCLAWLQPPTEGGVQLGQERPRGAAPAWRRRVCYVPQLPAIFPGSARQLARQVAGLAAQRGRPARDPRWFSRRWLVPDEAWEQPLARLSGGERQRLLLAVALAREPLWLLLDEPTSALDPAARAAVEQDLCGRSCLWVSHDHSLGPRRGLPVFHLGAS